MGRAPWRISSATAPIVRMPSSSVRPSSSIFSAARERPSATSSPKRSSAIKAPASAPFAAILIRRRHLLAAWQRLVLFPPGSLTRRCIPQAHIPRHLAVHIDRLPRNDLNVEPGFGHNHRFVAWATSFIVGIFIPAFGSAAILAQSPTPVQQANSPSKCSGLLGNSGKCSEAMGTIDGQTTGCLLSRGVGPNGFLPQFKIELCAKDGRRILLTPGGPIREWWFSHDGHQVTVSFDSAENRVSYALYDSATGHLVDKVGEEPHRPHQAPSMGQRPR